jgi:hypothetical protein
LLQTNVVNNPFSCCCAEIFNKCDLLPQKSKMLLRLVLGISFVAVVCARSCQNQDGEPMPNLCSTEKNAPFCINTAKFAKTPSYQCRQCATNCDCDPGCYCAMHDEDKKGECKKIEGDIIGRPCIQFWPYHELNYPELDVNDLMVCGVPVFNSSSQPTEFLYYDWLGYCDMGVCRSCLDTLMEGGLEDTYDIPSNMRTQLMLCPDRICSGNEWIPAEEGVVWGIVKMAGDNGTDVANLLFTIAISFILLTMCIRQIRNSRQDRPYSRFAVGLEDAPVSDAAKQS